MEAKIYIVSKGNEQRLVRAVNKARALAHVADEYTVELATQNALVASLQAGSKVEESK
jgi:hypothetical protein